MDVHTLINLSKANMRTKVGTLASHTMRSKEMMKEIGTRGSFLTSLVAPAWDVAAGSATKVGIMGWPDSIIGFGTAPACSMNASAKSMRCSLDFVTSPWISVVMKSSTGAGLSGQTDPHVMAKYRAMIFQSKTRRLIVRARRPRANESNTTSG